jgi:hypothetical protein
MLDNFASLLHKEKLRVFVSISSLIGLEVARILTILLPSTFSGENFH